MAFGALLTDTQGVPFYIDGTRPLTLINKITINVPGSGGTTYTQDLYANDGAVRFVFMQSNSNNLAFAEWITLENNTWRFYGTVGVRVVTLYVFGYSNQPVPTWGIAIWDAQGNCILTNESKPLRDVQQLGDISNENNSGFNINSTLAGSWAVAPSYTGLLAGVDTSTGQPRPINVWYYASSYFNGSSSNIRSHTHGSVAGLTQSGYVNSRNTLAVINVNNY